MIDKNNFYAIIKRKKIINKFGIVKNVEIKQMIKLNKDEEINNIRKLPEFCYYLDLKNKKWYNKNYQEINVCTKENI